MTHSYIFFLGAHPVLSRLELLQVVLSPTIVEATDEYMIVTVPSSPRRAKLAPQGGPLGAELQDILGGSDRFAERLGEFPTLPTAADIGSLLPPSTKKISIGLSGVGVDAGYLHRLGVDLKAWFQEQNRKMRFVVPTAENTRLNAAQVMAHGLDEEPNAELTIVHQNNGTFSVWRTVAVQDIRSYELRDTKRPARDPGVGMLPPKLAQIMLNFAMESLTNSPLPPPLTPPQTGGEPLSRERVILDPFCGMGTILQEGWLADYHMVGSDSSERMIRATEKNLRWLQSHFKVASSLTPRVFVHQADTRWSKRWIGAFDAIVTEPYLGKPVKAPLPHAVVTRRMNELGQLYHQVFRVSREVLKNEGTVVFALPAWRSERGGDEWQLFPEAFLDGISRLGYSRVHRLPAALAGADRAELIYARPDALVGRELTIWKKVESRI